VERCRAAKKALAKATMPVLGERGVIRYRIFQAQPAEPPVGKVEVHLFAQTSLSADP